METLKIIGIVVGVIFFVRLVILEITANKKYNRDKEKIRDFERRQNQKNSF